MIIEIGNWRIEKAGQSSDKVIPVRMIANRLQLDKENQEILPQAFNKATVDYFLKEGIIDWHHQSVLGKSPEERAAAIIGKPTGFQWEEEDGMKLPAVYANLTKNHPIVQNAILPHLEAEQPVFGASVGGNVKKAFKAWDSKSKKLKEQISEIRWDHLAIAGRPYVISAGTAVSMCKAYGNDDIYVRYSDIDTFNDQFELIEREKDIRKALEVGAGTNSSNLTSVDALRKQSLEGRNNDDALINNLLLALKNKDIVASRRGVELFLRAEGLSKDEAQSATSRLIEALRKIL